MKTSFPLSAAQEAQQENLLKNWVLDYLRKEGKNFSLADRIDRADLKVCLLEDIILDNFKRIIGPEEGLAFPESKEVFEARVKGLVEALEAGETFPPLVVTDFWDLGTIQDGAHRFEALVRTGYEKYPAIVCFEQESSMNFLR